MFPGFVTIYYDEQKFIHLYFFPGINNNGNQIYRKMNLNKSGILYKETVNEDKSIDFKFLDKNIKSFTCRLVNNESGQVKVKIINI